MRSTPPYRHETAVVNCASSRTTVYSRAAQPPIIAASGWREAYGGLVDDVARALEGAPDSDLTVELITHRYTAGSKAVLTSWYPGSALDMGGDRRVEKRTKFGAIKHVYDAPTMKELRGFFEAEIARMLPAARILYWT